MEIDAATYLFILVIILAGFFLKQLWVSLIFFVVLILMFVRGGKKNSKAAPKGGGSGVKVRPIIIKRKYEGPPTYPEKMTIKYTADLPSDWYEYGTEPVGKALGSGLRWLKSLFK